MIPADGARPDDYGAPERELRHAQESVALVDGSAFARLLATGPDLLGLLQRLSTGDVASLACGQGKSTVITSPKGRIVARVFVHHLGDDGVLLVGGEGEATSIADHLKRFTFREQTGLGDVTRETRQLTLIGPLAGQALDKAGLPVPEPLGTATAKFGGGRLRVLGQDGWSTEGFSVVCAADAADDLWTTLGKSVEGLHGGPAGAIAREAWRVLRGLPAAGRELTQDHNPLEAGLWDSVSFDKGCYVGQEVVARLRTYDKVSRSLVRLELPAGTPPPETGTKLLGDGRDVGRVTSALLPPGGSRAVALAYVKRKAIDSGVELHVGDAESPTVARVVE